MVDDICWALGELERNSSVNAIVIKSSNPKFFCAGADIKRFLKQDYEFYIRNEIFHILDTSFRSTKKPIIAAVNGKALGGGF
jgi:enoyl-CoA hydratase/carnithine racemase